MAKVKVDSSDNFEILEEYAYSDVDDAITLETSIIEGYGFDGKPDSQKNLLSFMVKKHHSIFRDEGAKKSTDAQFRSQARDPNTPIYLSYTLEGLNKVNSKPHEYAQYYAIGLKQPIGIIALVQLKKQN